MTGKHGGKSCFALQVGGPVKVWHHVRSCKLWMEMYFIIRLCK